MFKFLRLFCCLATIFMLGSLPNHLAAQSFSGAVEQNSSVLLSNYFSNYQVFKLDAATLGAYVKSNAEAPAQLKIGDHDWRLELSPSPILSENYSLTVQTKHGISTTYPKHNIAFKGYELNGGGKVRLALNGEFLYGFVEEGGERFYVEPLWYFEPDAARDLFVIYPKSAVSAFPTDACGVTQEQTELQHLEEGVEKEPWNGLENSGCYEVDLAIASDEQMLDKYGSVGAVENHNIGVINDVQGDYTGSFTHDIEFVIVTQFVSSNDPWTASTDAGVLLGSFQTWGNAGNFGVGFDVGELWTNRNFDGSTIGIAYLNGICNNNKYHCLQDFTNNPEFLRVLTSHELGHNFSSGHDAPGSPFIMAPAVQNTNQWSQQSIDAISNYTQAKINSGCLTACGPPPPPLVAGFDWLPNPGCQSQAVNFTDLSTGNITGWSWIFPGGTPASSTLQNPSVTWSLPGSKSVKLTISGVGGPQSITQTVEILPLPAANFTFTVNKYEVTFTNTSVNSTSYDWDFGDGLNSSEESPLHEYADAGTYVVILTASGPCGTSTKSITVNTAPKADFTASPLSGCAPLAVLMNNQSSSNAVNYNWSFPGGIPVASNQANPTVVYTLPGTYSITLRASNNSGADTIIRVDYIKVKTIPTAKFTAVVNGVIATFTNTSSGNPSSYLWKFGDGDTSIVTNPVHTYANPGTYNVILTATNECGSTSDTVSVVILSSAPPSAAFSVNPSSGCAPLTVNFTNNSTGAVSYSWSFPGGNPTVSTETNPTVVYDTAGVYTVTLTATNAFGSSTATSSITVNAAPVAGFTYVVNNDTSFVFTNTSTGATSYLWTFGDGDSSTVASPVHDYPAIDSIVQYTVIMQAINGCGVVSDTQIVSVITDPTAGFTASSNSGCAPLTVQFTNTSSSNATSFDWQFPGGTPSSSTAQTPPAIVYAVPGTYTVTLTASNSAGSSTSTQTIVVNGGPTANFSATVSGLTATFVNGSSNGTTYDWTFGDGGSSSDANPTHDYAADGTYTVVLTATNSCGTSTFTQNVVITTAPGAGFSVSTSSGCAVLTVNFTDISSGNPVSWAWDFPGGTPSSSTEQNPTVQYSVSGVYDVTLVVTSVGGGTSSFTQPGIITVNGTPLAGFTSSSNGSTVSFANTSSNATSYVWNFGDGSSSMEENPSHTYLTDGEYTVTLLATNNCGTTILDQIVVVSTPPTASFTTSGNTGCAPFTVQFTNASSSNASSYQWDFPGGNPSSSTDANPSIVWNTAGVYTVTLTAFNAAGSSSSTTTIKVGTAPTAGFTYEIGGLTAVFNNMSINGTSYSWDFGDGSIPSTELNPSHTYSQVGAYVVTLSATNECGTVTTTQTVLIEGAPPVPAISSNNSEGCLPFAAQFTDQSAGNPTAWSWTFQGGTPATSTQQDPLVNYNAPGTYDVVLEVTNIFGTATQTFPAYITVQPPPTASFTYVANQLAVTFTSVAQNATSYAWTFGDGGTSSEQNPTHTYANAGSYNVFLIVSNNCGTFVIEQIVTITSGTGEASWVEGFRLFPNPNTGSFTVEMNGLPQDEVEFVLFNMLGQHIRRETMDFGTGSMLRNFDYGDLAAGVYTLRIQAAGQAMLVKVTVSR
jgi:PKD repeat protein